MATNTDIKWSGYRRLLSCRVLAIVCVYLWFSVQASAQSITDVVEWTGTISLEEPEGVFTVTPMVSIDPSGGFMVADFSESQVRLYTRSGKLKTRFGESGSQSPGALEGPGAPVRIGPGRILVPDIATGSISIFNEDGTFVRRHERVAPSATTRLRDLPGDDLLLIGAEALAPGALPLLHRFDPESGTKNHSFFPHPVPVGSFDNYLFHIGNIAAADVRGQEIVAAFAIQNRLHFFDLKGNFLRDVTLPLTHFRPLQKPARQPQTRAELADIEKTYTRISNVFWLDDETILIQYLMSTDFLTGGVRWYLAAVTPRGEVIWDIADTPKLFAVDPDTQELFFSHPDHDFENEWIVGRLKRGSS